MLLLEGRLVAPRFEQEGTFESRTHIALGTWTLLGCHRQCEEKAGSSSAAGEVCSQDGLGSALLGATTRLLTSSV